MLITGMMAVGKSTIGQAVADLLGWPYVDNDDLVEAGDGRPTADVLEESGVASLRRVERAALDAALALPAPLVAGVAGGVIEDHEARRLMRAQAFVVHLRAPLALLAERIRRDEAEARAGGEAEPRPWIDDDPEVVLAQLHAGRAELYEETADVVVDVEGRTPDDIAAEVVAALARGQAAEARTGNSPNR